MINTENQSKWLPLVDKNLEELKEKVSKLMKEFKLNSTLKLGLLIVLIITGLYIWFPFQQGGFKNAFKIRIKEGKRL